MKTRKKEKSDKPRRALGIQEAADYCGVSRNTMRSWIAEGKVPYIQFPGGRGHGDQVYRGAKLDVKDLDQFIDRSKDRNA